MNKKCPILAESCKISGDFFNFSYLFSAFKNPNVQTLTSLEELLEILPKCSGSEFVQIAKKLNLQSEEFEPYSFWDKETYTRNCVSRNEDYELILLCWEPGQETPVHDHNGEECWVYALKGDMEEIRYQDSTKATERITESKRSKMLEGSVAYMDDNLGYHSLHNRTQERALTLHLYMKPIDSCKIYDTAEGAFIRKDMQYDTKDGREL